MFLWNDFLISGYSHSIWESLEKGEIVIKDDDAGGKRAKQKKSRKIKEPVSNDKRAELIDQVNW